MATLPEELNFKQMLGAGFLGGIGFTMSIFITLLAFNRNDMIEQSRMAVMLSSLIAGFIGFVMLKFVLKKPQAKNGLRENGNYLV